MIERNSVQKSAESLNIIDDTLFEKMAEDIGFCEEVISTILMQKVTVLKVMKQKHIKNLQGRSVILDALCEMESGNTCNIEVQKSNDDNHVKRVRYNASCITANITDPGTKFEKVPDVIVIFISKFDMFRAGKTIYHIDRTIRETGELNDNGLCEIYVNARIDDGTDISELMKIFSEQDAYDFQKFPKTSERKHYFLRSEGGKKEMCKIVEDFAKEYAEQVVIQKAKETARKYFESGGDYERAKLFIDSLSDKELEEIYSTVLSEK